MTSDDDLGTEDLQDLPGPSSSECSSRRTFEQRGDIEEEIAFCLSPLKFEERRRERVTKEDTEELDTIHAQLFAIIRSQRDNSSLKFRMLKDAFDHSKCVREQIYILRGDESVVEDKECTNTYLTRLSCVLRSTVEASFEEEYRKSAILLGLVDALAEVLILEVAVFRVDLKSNEHRSIRKSIANALTNLTFKQQQSKRRLCLYSEFIDTIVQIIMYAPNLVQVYASIIRNLSWKAEDEMAGNRLSACVPALAIALVRAYKQHDKLCVQATLCALWNLASHSNRNKAAICDTQDCLEVLALLLDCDPAKTSSVESASGILKYVTQYLSTTSTHLEIRPKLVSRLLELLYGGTFTTITNALGALTNLVIKDPHLQNLIRHDPRAMQQLNTLRNSARDDIRGAVKNMLNYINQPSTTRYGGMSYSYVDTLPSSSSRHSPRYEPSSMGTSHIPPPMTHSPRLLPLRMNRPSPGASVGGVQMQTTSQFEGRSASLPRYLHNQVQQNSSHMSPRVNGFNMGPVVRQQQQQQQQQQLKGQEPEHDQSYIDPNEASESILCTRGGSPTSINNLSEQPSGGWCSTAETERSSARLSPVSYSELPSSPTLCQQMNLQPPFGNSNELSSTNQPTEEAGGSTASTALIADQITPTIGPNLNQSQNQSIQHCYQMSPMLVMTNPGAQNMSFNGQQKQNIESPDDNLPAPSMGDNDFYATLQMDVDLLTRSIESALPPSTYPSSGTHSSRRRYQQRDEAVNSRRHSGGRRSGSSAQADRSTDNERLLREAILSEMPQQNGQSQTNSLRHGSTSKNAWGDFCETNETKLTHRERDTRSRPEKSFDESSFLNVNTNQHDLPPILDLNCGMSSDSSASSTVDASIPTDCIVDDLTVDCKLAMKRKTRPPASHLPLPANSITKTGSRIVITTRSPARKPIQSTATNTSSTTMSKIAATVPPYNYKNTMNNRPSNVLNTGSNSPSNQNSNSSASTVTTIQSNPKQMLVTTV